MGQKAVTRNRTENPAEHSRARITTEGTTESSSTPTRSLRFTSGVQKGHGGGIGCLPIRGGWAQIFHPRSSPILPANSAILNAATNDSQERSNPPAPLGSEQPVGRMTPGGRIGPEANARGKATGYADGATRG
jgi:hypothetical protein